MCTVSIISTPSGQRLVVNRDEERDRPPALAPRWHDVGSARAIWPVDPLGGGTWVAATTQGIAFCLLNGNPEPRPAHPSADRVLSRGIIIPTLANSTSVQHAIEEARALELDRFPPFRLVAVQSGRIASLTWDGARADVADHFPVACCFVSSGLGDRCVTPRLALFAQMVDEGGATPEQQDLFHQHRWPERPELSVWMSRAGARTVSRTVVTLGRPGLGQGVDAQVEMQYHEVAEPARPGHPSRVGLMGAAGREGQGSRELRSSGGAGAERPNEGGESPGPQLGRRHR